MQLGGAEITQSVKAVSDQVARKSYKDRFLVKIRDHIQSLKSEEATMFYAEGRTVYLVTEDGRRYIIDYKLEALGELLQPDKFYRVNRTIIVNIDAIKDVIVYSNSRLKVVLSTDFDKEIIVSRDKVSAFKGWFEGK